MSKNEEKVVKKRGRPAMPKHLLKCNQPRIKKYTWECDISTDDGEYLTTLKFKTLHDVVVKFPKFTTSQVYDYAVRRKDGIKYKKVSKKYKNHHFRRITSDGYVPIIRKPKNEDLNENIQKNDLEI